MIPVQNIYYMLSYAFQSLQAQNYKNLATEKLHNTAELCAAILDKGISIQLKRGLGRDYVPKSESLSTLQGKLNISESIKTQALLKKQIICTYDEFSTNTQLSNLQCYYYLKPILQIHAKRVYGICCYFFLMLVKLIYVL